MDFVYWLLFNIPTALLLALTAPFVWISTINPNPLSLESIEYTVFVWLYMFAGLTLIDNVIKACL